MFQPDIFTNGIRLNITDWYVERVHRERKVRPSDIMGRSHSMNVHYTVKDDMDLSEAVVLLMYREQDPLTRQPPVYFAGIHVDTKKKVEIKTPYNKPTWNQAWLRQRGIHHNLALFRLDRHWHTYLDSFIGLLDFPVKIPVDLVDSLKNHIGEYVMEMLAEENKQRVRKFYRKAGGPVTPEFYEWLQE